MSSELEEKSTQEESVIDDDLVSFFDLLAKFDYEDNQKFLGVNIDPPVSAPGGSILVSENSKDNYGRADTQNTQTT